MSNSNQSDRLERTLERTLDCPAAVGKASCVLPSQLSDAVQVVPEPAYRTAVWRGDVYACELRRQSLEAWMRGDWATADRLAGLIGDPLPSEHERLDSGK